MHGQAVRRGSVLLAALLLALGLFGCATRDKVDLPQLDELRRELLDCSGNVEHVYIYHYSTAPFLSIDIEGRELSREEAFALVRTVREMVSEEDFQRDYYNLRHSESGWERIMSGQYYPDDMRVNVIVDGGYYLFEAQLFSDGAPSTGGKGEVYDGYSTWRGSYEPFERDPSGRKLENIYFSHEDICE